MNNHFNEEAVQRALSSLENMQKVTHTLRDRRSDVKLASALSESWRELRSFVRGASMELNYQRLGGTVTPDQTPPISSKQQRDAMLLSMDDFEVLPPPMYKALCAVRDIWNMRSNELKVPQFMHVDSQYQGNHFCIYSDLVDSNIRRFVWRDVVILNICTDDRAKYRISRRPSSTERIEFMQECINEVLELKRNVNGREQCNTLVSEQDHCKEVICG